MPLSDFIRESKLMRAPLLGASKLLFSLLQTGPTLLRRAAYDAMPVPYLVTGQPEKFVISTADKVIGRELFLHGEFDFQKLVTALEILKQEGRPVPIHLIDVGANIGTIVIPALSRGLMQSATAIEPHPANLRLLRANLALNDVADRVRVLPQAVGAKSDETLLLHESSTNSGNHAIGSAGLPVQSTQLDDIEDPRDDALLWMDIEGYEGHAHEGAKRLLAAGVPVVSEFNPEFLAKSGGMDMFKNALKTHRIFDLQAPERTQTTLDEITVKLRRKDQNLQWTDILAVP